MARVPTCKELEHSRLLKEYASWVYCARCNKTVAYLCYVTYDAFDFTYTCGCGGEGRVHIEFEHDPATSGERPLTMVRNRLCCPEDESPLVTVVDKNLSRYALEIVCRTCHKSYTVLSREG